MEDKAEGLPANTTERSESLKPFSDGDLLGELESRLNNNPSIDPKILRRLKTTTAELERRTEALKQPQAESEKPAEINIPAADPKVEDSAESEGAKWAEVLREEGVGMLRGKFRKSWTFTNPSGKKEQISDKEGPFTGGGAFGDTGLTIGVTREREGPRD